MSSEEINKQVNESKTICCNADWYVKSRANFRCKKCDEDVTMHIVLLHKALID